MSGILGFIDTVGLSVNIYNLTITRKRGLKILFSKVLKIIVYVVNAGPCIEW